MLAGRQTIGVASARQTRRGGDRPAHAHNGQSLVEFALVSVIFLTMVYGIISGARLLYMAEAVNNAAQNGARQAIVANIQFTQPLTSTLSGVGLDAVLARTLSALGPVPIDHSRLDYVSNTQYGNNNILLTGSPDLCRPTMVTVSISFTAALVPGRLLGPGGIPIRAHSTMIVRTPATSAQTCL